MATTEQTFRELLNSAPVEEDVPLQLTGWLSRAHQADHFILGLADGTSITLPIAAVKEHTVLGGSAGRAIVNLSLDRSAIPAEVLATATAASADGTNTVVQSVPPNRDLTDQPIGPGHTGRFLDLIPIGTPFGLATAHQSAAAATLAAQGVSSVITRKWLHDGFKQPEADLTTPPHLDI